jgi:hypothetical protein
MKWACKQHTENKTNCGYAETPTNQISKINSPEIMSEYYNHLDKKRWCQRDWLCPAPPKCGHPALMGQRHRHLPETSMALTDNSTYPRIVNTPESE